MHFMGTQVHIVQIWQALVWLMSTDKDVSINEYDSYNYLEYVGFNRKTNENIRYNDYKENKHNISSKNLVDRWEIL